MGAALDTPARCPLCNELTREPVTLKCNHQFCQRCIGDLWSITPTGPFHCPEWKCKTVYQTLPFDRSLIRSPAPSRAAPSRSNTGTPSTDDSMLGRPSLTSRLLGKRKASTPVSEQPAKRSTVDSPQERPNDTETAATSSSDKPVQPPVQETPEKSVDPVSAQSYDGATPENSDRNAKRIRRKSDTLDESDSSSEVDLCETPLTASPKTTSHVTGNHASSKKPALQGNESSPPFTPSKGPASALASAERVGIFLRPESRNPGPVPCHYCPKSGCQSAVKTCLVCGASMCKEHLRPHLESTVFQNHTLVPPMADISLWRCLEHQEINRIYCRECGVCVCTVCTVIGSHRDHVCISIREAERELRANLKDEIKQLQEAEQQVKTRVAEFSQMKETCQAVLSEARAGVKQQYAAIREALEQEEQSALQCVMKEEAKVLGGLADKLSLLQSSLQSIQNGLHSLEGLADTKGDRHVQDQAFIMEYSKVSQLSANTGNFMEQCEDPEEVDRARLRCLQKWTEKRLDDVVITMPGKDRELYTLLYGTIPVLDADTAHPKLQLSDDSRRVTYSEAQQAYAEHEARFSSFPQVLASGPLEGGRWYWEVEVSMDDGRWKVGVCEGQIERKGQKDSSRLGFNGHSWCLACDKRKVEAVHNKEAVPVKADGLKRVGVFVDFEVGGVSFFNVTPGGSLALLHSYKHRFSNPLFPAFSVSKTHLAVCHLFRS
ncbi:unnamed protein product [Menidia menidia]|uniref:(Atlantic silverside) hypothetical protein n=1 Tax=Menidia menidia TaxID=238744 RepID=A0A8S4BGJ7_9TELE|nr:unnamed protein product [Menidia menidia]